MYNSLQYVRAYAALLVLYFHAVLLVNKNYEGLVVPVMGSSGVALFFVLSGILMVIVRAHNTMRPFHFLLKRMVRIVPLYWSVTIFYVLVYYFLPEVMNSVQITSATLIKSLFFIPYENPALEGEVYPIVIPGWTLNFEVVFYLVFAIAMYFSGFMRLVVLLGALFLVYFVSYFIADSVLSFYSHPYFFCFLSGVLLGFLSDRLTEINKPLSIFMLVFSVMFFVVSLILENMLLDVLSASLLVFSMFVYERGAGRLFRNRFLAITGDSSYSLYLTHGMVLAVIMKICILLNLPWYVCLLLCLVVSWVVGLMVYNLYERHLTKYFSNLIFG